MASKFAKLWWAQCVLLWGLATESRAAVLVGAGLSSQTSGRMAPALDLGIDIGPLLLTGMMGGVETDAYYHNYYTANLLFGFRKWGSGYLGEVWAGIGFGGHLSKKGLKDLDDQSTTANETSGDSSGFGPAFRVEARPFAGPVYFAVNYTMGLGPAAFAGGFGDSGLFAVGVHL